MNKYVKKSFQITFSKNKRNFRLINSNKVSHPHGSVIATIIKNIIDKIEIISINILDKNLTSDGRLLIYSLRMALKYKPNIINLSLGTTSIIYAKRLNKIVRKAKKKNIMIVASAENGGQVSYPAYLKDVIGVKGSDKYVNNILYKDNFFIAHNSADNIPEVVNMNLSRVVGNSISAAYTTGFIAKMMQKSFIGNKRDVINILNLEEL